MFVTKTNNFTGDQDVPIQARQERQTRQRALVGIGNRHALDVGEDARVLGRRRPAHSRCDKLGPFAGQGNLAANSALSHEGKSDSNQRRICELVHAFCS